MVWVFQEGHPRVAGRGLRRHRPSGYHDASTHVLRVRPIGGLRGFLLSRIQEEGRATGNNNTAVARGLGRTGRLVLAAAARLRARGRTAARSSAGPPSEPVSECEPDEAGNAQRKWAKVNNGPASVSQLPSVTGGDQAGRVCRESAPVGSRSARSSASTVRQI